MRKSGLKRIYAMSAANARKTAIEILEREGKTNIKVNMITPFQDDDKGYNVFVSYEEALETTDKIDLKELKDTRKVAMQVESDIINLSLQVKELSDVLNQIRNNCQHKIVVKLQEWDLEDMWDEAYCLNCNQHFHGPFIMFDRNFKDIIHFEDLNFDGDEITDQEKVVIALHIFEEERKLNPEFTDSKIVAIINEKIQDKPDQILESKKMLKKSYGRE